MEAIYVFAFVFAMANPADEELQVSAKPMTLRECKEQVERMTERYLRGGRWSESYRFFAVRCVDPRGGVGLGGNSFNSDRPMKGLR